MIKKKITLVCAVLIITLNSYSQDAENKIVATKSNELGIHAGFTTGVGFSYRHWTETYGIQITALPLKSRSSEFLSVGVTGLYSLSNEEDLRHFVYFGNHLTTNRHSSYYDNEPSYDFVYNIGFGYGFEIGRNVRYNFMLGYAGYNIFDEDYRLWPTAEMGVYFKLKKKLK